MKWSVEYRRRRRVAKKRAAMRPRHGGRSGYERMLRWKKQLPAFVDAVKEGYAPLLRNMRPASNPLIDRLNGAL